MGLRFQLAPQGSADPCACSGNCKNRYSCVSSIEMLTSSHVKRSLKGKGSVGSMEVFSCANGIGVRVSLDC